MGAVDAKTRTVFHSPTAGRSYLTKAAAASAEARALITRKYPTEHSDLPGGARNCVWHWTDDERLRRVHARLSKQIRARSIHPGRA